MACAGSVESTGAPGLRVVMLGPKIVQRPVGLCCRGRLAAVAPTKPFPHCHRFPLYGYPTLLLDWRHGTSPAATHGNRLE